MKAKSSSLLTLALALTTSLPLSSSADEAASGTKMRLIPGRIEQTADTQAPLPIELTKQTAKLDTSAPKPSRLIQTGIEQADSLQTTFPPQLLGYWGGEMTISAAYQRSGEPDPFRVPGATAQAVFHFYKDAGEVKLKPATLFLLKFLARPLKDCLLGPKELESLRKYAAEQGKEVDPNMILQRSQEIALGGFGGTRIDGATRQVTVTANTLRTLGPQVIEQDIVGRRKGVNDDESHAGYFEVICRFEQTGPDTEFVRVAKLGYNSERVMNERIVVEGNVSRDWKPTADRISRELKHPWESIARHHDI